MKSLYQILFLGFMVVFLGSCSQEENTELNKMKGDLVVLKVSIDGIEDKSPNTTSTKGEKTESLIQTKDLGNGFVLETSIKADLDTKFSGSNNLNPGSSILALVYKTDRAPYKYQYLTTTNSEIYLPQGHEFRIVFYSYNNDTQPSLTLATGSKSDDGHGGFLLTSDATFSENNELNTHNVLCARIENTGTISQMTKLPNILFTPLFSRLSWELYNESGNSFSVSGAQIEKTFESARVNMNSLVTSLNFLEAWTGVGSSNINVCLNYSTSTGSSLKSDKRIFIVDETKSTSLSSTITTESGVTPVSYSLGNLERGVSYRVVSKLTPVNTKYSVSFASSGLGSVTNNGVVEGNVGSVVTSTANATSGASFLGWFDGDTKVIASTGDVFVSGTTLSVKLTESTNSKAYVARFDGSIIIEPGECAPRIFVSGTGDDAVLQLTEDPRNPGVYFQFGSIKAWSYSNPLTLVWNGSDNTSGWNSSWGVGSSFPVISNANLKSGWGDPCRLVGYTQGYVKSELAAGRVVDNKTWRLPTNSENGTFGSKYSKWTALYGVSGRYFGEGATTEGTGGQFLPASGYRNATDGSILAQGTNGVYWSSTTGGSSTGYYLSFDSSNVFPERHNYQASGYSVRCVRQ